MRRASTALGIAILLGSASLAFAAQTRTEMQQSLEAQGYSEVHNWKNVGEGTSVQAMKDGQNWTLVLSYQGQIVRREAASGGAQQGNTSATGVTSGPGAGKPTAPNTAVAAGAPGTPAKPGTEAGVAPQKPASQ